MTTSLTTQFTITPDQQAAWTTEGYLIIRHCFTADEVAAVRRRFDEMAEGPPIEGYWMPDRSPASAADPLKRHPRMMHPHRYDELSRRMMLHPRVREVLRVLYGVEPMATQSMYYFKPPGARGQALHQDNFYLQVKPGTCIAAWTAIDPATPENGGLYVVPGTQDMEVVCPETADAGESFTTHLVRAPKGKKAVPAEMQPGDTLFFNGSIVHGSPPNRSKTLWRRSFICHYMPGTATHINKSYFPIYNFDGGMVEFQSSEGGGPCGEEFDPGAYGSAGRWH